MERSTWLLSPILFSSAIQINRPKRLAALKQLGSAAMLETGETFGTAGALQSQIAPNDRQALILVARCAKRVAPGPARPDARGNQD
jgi:hypothetical protein